MKEALNRLIQELTARAIVHEMREIETQNVGGSSYVIDMVAKEAYDFAASELKLIEDLTPCIDSTAPPSVSGGRT